jgi:hypothetical protein
MLLSYNKDMIKTRQYCVFFNGLTDDLQKSVKNICENAPDKSKIYSNIKKDIDILVYDDDLQRSARISKTFKTEFTTRLNNFIFKMRLLDEVMDLYNEQTNIDVDVDKDYFFFRLLKHCIRMDNPIRQDKPITQDILGEGKRKTKMRKTKMRKTKMRKTKMRKTKKLLL